MPFIARTECVPGLPHLMNNAIKAALTCYEPPITEMCWREKAAV